MSYYPTTFGNLAINASVLYGAGPSYVINSSAARGQTVTLTGPVIQCDKDADIRFGDTSLMATLREIQTQLGIVTRDTKLEEEFDELRACAEKYEQLRTKFLEQKRMWDTLKQQDI